MTSVGLVCGDLDRVSKIVKVLAFVNGAPGFADPHRVADGASQPRVEILGDSGRHARSAVVAADLPFGACVEIEMVAEIQQVELLVEGGASRPTESVA